MLKVGLLVDEYEVSEIVYDLIEKSKNAQHYNIETFIVVASPKIKMRTKLGKAYNYLKRWGVRKFIAKAAWPFIRYIDQQPKSFAQNFTKHLRSHPLSNFDMLTLKVNPIISKSGFVYRFSDEDLESVKSLNLDVLIRCGSGILRGGILNVCKFGILSFHHANNDKFRGSTPGFWEVYNKEPTTGFIIQQLTEELDGGDVIYSGNIATSYFFSLNQARLYRKANIFLHKILEQCGESGKLPLRKIKKPYAYPLYGPPNFGQQVNYLLFKMAPQILAIVVNKFSNKRPRWGVAFQFVDDWKESVLWRSTVITNPKNRYLADPFIWKKEGKVFCFVEDYDFKINRGCISVYELKNGGYNEVGPVLTEPFHMSYPFLFEWNGSLFMCPETEEINEIRLYRCEEFPKKWVYHKTLMKGVSAADTSIVKFGNKWWMLTNIDSSHLGDHGSELHIYHSESPESDDWIPHTNNPVIFDAECARNGGLIIDGNRIYRVFQRQGFNAYGISMGISEINLLDENNYKETVYCNIPPKFFDGIIGTHSFAYYKGVLAIDFVKLEKISN